jgi:hypothetical protein
MRRGFRSCAVAALVATCALSVTAMPAQDSSSVGFAGAIDSKQYAALRWKPAGAGAANAAGAKCDAPAGTPRAVANSDGKTHAVCADPLRKGLLYAATTNGVYVSFDDGAHWQSLELNLPVADVRELRVARDDLIVVSAARKAWILEDVSPLRQAGPDLDSAAAYLLEPVTATAERGATIDYYFRETPKNEVTIEVRNAQRKVVKTFNSATDAERLTKHAGLNRIAWNLRGLDGAALAPGKYEVMLIGADTIMKRTLIVQ